LDTGVLGTAVNGVQARRVRHSKEIADIMMGMDGIEPLKGTGRPNLQLVSRKWEIYSSRIEGLYIDDRIASAGKEQVSLFRKVQVQDTFLVSTNRENKVVVVKRPRL
jgi:hypothetical protein